MNKATKGTIRVEIEFREAMPADQQTIAEFNSRLAHETEGKQLNPDLVGPGVAALLADSEKGRYWFAIIDGEIAGQIMLTYEWSDWRNGMFWWIQSVYIAVKFRRKGVFSALYHFVESRAKEDKNLRAQEIYRNLNMTEPGYRVMESIFTKTQRSHPC